MADPSIISNVRFTYVHDHHKHAVDTHHIIARRSTLKPIVTYLLAMLLVAYSVFLHLEKGKPVTTVIWSFFFAAIFVILLIWRPIVKESVVIMPEFGVQLETHYGSGAGDNEDTQVINEGQVVPQTTKFKYLGSFVQRDGGIDSDVSHRIQVGWCKWRAATGILCDRRFPTKLKGKFYRIAVRPAMLYGTECWAIKKTQARKMEVAEMRMLRWMCGHTRLDRIRSEVYRDWLGVASISDKLKEGRLRWFGHVKRKQLTEPVRAVETITVEGMRGRGRSKLTWDKRLRKDLVELHLSEDMVQDRSSWRRRIKVKDL